MEDNAESPVALQKGRLNRDGPFGFFVSSSLRMTRYVILSEAKDLFYLPRVLTSKATAMMKMIPFTMY